jgi:2,4-dichlorophenol 6-monooxygenase
MREIDVPVLIVGGGGCGLSASSFLSDHRVDHLVLERRESTSRKPKAHYLNQRTMEIFRQHGMWDVISEASAPIEKMGHLQWKTSLGGDGPLDRRIFRETDAFGGGTLRKTYEADGPVVPSNLPQIRLEPLLRRLAEDRAPGRVLFNHTLTEIAQDDEGVTALAKNNETDEIFRVRAHYAIGADAGHIVGPSLGVKLEGPTGLVDMVGVHFRADLSQWWDDRVLITFFNNPEGAGTWASGAAAALGPTWGKHSEEWVLHFAFSPDDPARHDDAAMVGRIRQLLKLPELQLDVCGINHWVQEAVLADRFQVGRIFLAGDAAHRHPPTTGLGLNTAIQDVHNLAWKLSMVLNYGVPPSLLCTYESERKPVGRRNVDWAMFTFTNHAITDMGLGIIPGAPLDQNQEAFAALLADNDMGETLRARAEEVFQTARIEFNAHDIELGYYYGEGGALVPDGSQPPKRDPMGTIYRPTTRPGHRLPHAWLESEGRDRLSTHDLAPTDPAFLLLIGERGAAWSEVAQRAGKAAGVPVDVVSIGSGCDFEDSEGSWTKVREIDDDGAILVRPDNHVAWRSVGAVADPLATLTDALSDVIAA